VIAAATVLYLVCFQCAAAPAIFRILKRRTSSDLSTWREWLLLCGVCVQFGVMWASGVRSWAVLASPIVSACSLLTLLIVVYRHR
jgi:predicted membrane protein